MRILIVEKDSTHNKAICDMLATAGYQTDSSENYKDAEYFVGIRNYNLIVSEWELDKSYTGIDLINAVKSKSRKTSVVIMIKDYSVNAELDALAAGADDVIRIPYNPKLFLARLKARLRFGSSNIISIDELKIDPDEEKITYKDAEIELKGKPFEVLTHLARYSDQIVSKEQLLDAIWEEPELVTPNVIEVAINQIRQKMDKPLGISTIETVRRRGYRFCFHPDSDDSKS